MYAALRRKGFFVSVFFFRFEEGKREGERRWRTESSPNSKAD